MTTQVSTEKDVRDAVERAAVGEVVCASLEDHYRNFGYRLVSQRNEDACASFVRNAHIDMWNTTEAGYITMEGRSRRHEVPFPEIRELRDRKNGDRLYELAFGYMRLVISPKFLNFAGPVYPARGLQMRHVFIQSKTTDRYINLEVFNIAPDVTSLLSFCSGIPAIVRRKDTGERFVVLFLEVLEDRNFLQWDSDALLFAWLHEHGHLVSFHENILQSEILANVACLALIDLISARFPDEVFFDRQDIINRMERSLERYRQAGY